MDLLPQLSRDGRLVKTDRGWRLEIFAGTASNYRLAQLDDQGSLPRSQYVWHRPITMSLTARVAAPSAPGTWGFGFWNDPFGLSLPLGHRPARLPALPRTAWFFHASPRSYLSFRDDRAAHGFLAQTFESSKTPPWMMLAGLALPFAPRAVRRRLSHFIDEDSSRIESDPSRWHRYKIEWRHTGTAFWVDGSLVLKTSVSPSQPLAIVIWVDNQYAAFDPRGKLRWGTESNRDGFWLEIQDLQVGA